MKKLIYSMLALFCVAVTFTSCGNDGVSDELPDKGSKNNPYSVAEAIDAVKDLTWTSNTEHDKTGDVYVKGKISRIANHGTYSESGSYGNASFYISDDGDEENEFSASVFFIWETRNLCQVRLISRWATRSSFVVN